MDIVGERNYFQLEGENAYVHVYACMTRAILGLDGLDLGVNHVCLTKLSTHVLQILHLMIKQTNNNNNKLQPIHTKVLNGYFLLLSSYVFSLNLLAI